MEEKKGAQDCMHKEEHIGFQARSLANLISRKITKGVIAEDGIDGMTARHGWIIGYLCQNKDRDIYQKDLEDKFDLAKSTVTSILKLMEKKGYITRSSVENDARLKKLQVTPLGEETHRRAEECIMRIEEEIKGYLTPDEFYEYMRITKKLKDRIKNESGGKETEEC